MKRKREKMTIKIKPAKPSIGHQSHGSGSGAHDSRPKRMRTRQAKRTSWKREFNV